MSPTLHALPKVTNARDILQPPKIAPVLEPPHDNPETKINKATHPTSLTEHVNQYTSIETLKTIGTNPIDPGSKYLTYSPKVNTVEGIVPVLNNAIYPSLKSTNIINEADIKKWGIWKEWKQDKGGDTDDDFDTWKEWKEWCDENEDEDEDNDEDEDEDDDDDNEDDDNDDDEDEEYKDKSGGYDDNDAKSWTDWSNWKDWCQKNNLQENLGEVWKEWKDWKKQTNRNTSQQDSMNPQNSWDNWKDWKDWCAENDMEGSAQEWNSWELWKYETKQDIYTENDDLEESWNEWKEWNSWCKENNIDLTETPGFESLEHKKLIEKQTWEAWKKMKSIVKSGTEKE
ncbi:hypothetical protein CLU79DRAFT_845895 [Phycomyces nitens]|nr:hypothetical protein CLU79DRAFT_845895 [Phycomyces nitens]